MASGLNGWSAAALTRSPRACCSNFKFTFAVEIVPICRDDLVCLPLKFAQATGNCAQLLLCAKVGNSLHLIDPLGLQGARAAAVFAEGRRPMQWALYGGRSCRDHSYRVLAKSLQCRMLVPAAR